MNIRKISIFVSFLFLLSVNLFAIEPLPKGYSNIFLGMTLSETKEQLIKNPDFGYHGDRDVSLLPNSTQVLIETDSKKGYGSSFLRNCWFQFNDDKLYIITINLNTEKVDYYSMFTTLCNKYGNPDSLDPQRAVWKNNEITMSLEKPLLVKYIDNKTFDDLSTYSNINKTAQETLKQNFLDEF